MSDFVRLTCLLWGQKFEQAFKVKIHRMAELHEFKQAISRSLRPYLGDVPNFQLDLYKIQIPITDDTTPPKPELRDEFKLHPAYDIEEEFPVKPLGKHIHVFVKHRSGK